MAALLRDLIYVRYFNNRCFVNKTSQTDCENNNNKTAFQSKASHPLANKSFSWRGVPRNKFKQVWGDGEGLQVNKLVQVIYRIVRALHCEHAKCQTDRQTQLKTFLAGSKNSVCPRKFLLMTL